MNFPTQSYRTAPLNMPFRDLQEPYKTACTTLYQTINDNPKIEILTFLLGFNKMSLTIVSKIS